jgi:hypothetical protein
MKRIAIHSAPRSGSSWLGQILNSSRKVCFRFQPLFSYAFKDYLNEKSSQEDISTFFEKIAKSNDDFLIQSDKVDNGKYPSFSKDNKFTHIVYKEVRYHNIIKNMMIEDKDLLVIGLVRSPYAVIDSFLRSPREFRKDLGWDEEEWKYAMKKNLDKSEEFFGYEKWKEVYLIFNDLKEKFNDRFCLIYYDDLIKNPLNEVEKIFNFCNLEMNKQTIKFIKDSKSAELESVYSVFRNKLNDNKWKNTLNKNIYTEICNDLKINNMNHFLRAK